jgi:hypothetical protein
MESLIGKKVEVGIVGLVYTGKLVEVGETELHLESDAGWLAIPLSQIVYVKEAREKEISLPDFDF